MCRDSPFISELSSLGDIHDLSHLKQFNAVAETTGFSPTYASTLGLLIRENASRSLLGPRPGQHNIGPDWDALHDFGSPFQCSQCGGIHQESIPCRTAENLVFHPDSMPVYRCSSPLDGNILLSNWWTIHDRHFSSGSAMTLSPLTYSSPSSVGSSPTMFSDASSIIDSPPLTARPCDIWPSHSRVGATADDDPSGIDEEERIVAFDCETLKSAPPVVDMVDVCLLVDANICEKEEFISEGGHQAPVSHSLASSMEESPVSIPSSTLSCETLTVGEPAVRRYKPASRHSTPTSRRTSPATHRHNPYPPAPQKARRGRPPISRDSLGRSSSKFSAARGDVQGSPALSSSSDSSSTLSGRRSALTLPSSSKDTRNEVYVTLSGRQSYKKSSYRGDASEDEISPPPSPEYDGHASYRDTTGATSDSSFSSSKKRGTKRRKERRKHPTTPDDSEDDEENDGPWYCEFCVPEETSPKKFTRRTDKDRHVSGCKYNPERAGPSMCPYCSWETPSNRWDAVRRHCRGCHPSRPLPRQP